MSRDVRGFTIERTDRLTSPVPVRLDTTFCPLSIVRCPLMVSSLVIGSVVQGSSPLRSVLRQSAPFLSQATATREANNGQMTTDNGQMTNQSFSVKSCLSVNDLTCWFVGSATRI